MLLHPKPDLFTFFNAIAGFYEIDGLMRNRIVEPFHECIREHGGNTDRLSALYQYESLTRNIREAQVAAATSTESIGSVLPIWKQYQADAHERMLRGIGSPPFNKIQFGFAWETRTLCASILTPPGGMLGGPPRPTESELRGIVDETKTLIKNSIATIDSGLQCLDYALFAILTDTAPNHDVMCERLRTTAVWSPFPEDELLAAGFPPKDERDRWAATSGL